MKMLLFHAVPPESHQSRIDWEGFLREAADFQLPAEAERLAPYVWLLPAEGRAYLDLANIGRNHAIETRCQTFVHGSGWQPLSPPP